MVNLLYDVVVIITNSEGVNRTFRLVYTQKELARALYDVSIVLISVHLKMRDGVPITKKL